MISELSEFLKLMININILQEEESATNSSKSNEEASDQTISDNSDNDDVINISDDNDVDNADIGINENVSKKRKPPSKITRPKTSWVWNFFRETEDGTHHITKGIAMSYLKALQKELFTKNVIGFVIGTVQPLSIVENKDFIKM
ncbi:4683_t:CDS:2, partial [Rhizophagus irregularis]